MYMAREKSTVKVKTCVLYYVKHIVKVNDDFKGCHNLEHRSRVVNLEVPLMITTIVIYYRNTFM